MTTDPANLDWLLKNFVENTAGARLALVLSRDGLPVGQYGAADLQVGNSDEVSGHLSAIASGLHSLGDGAARLLDGNLTDAAGASASGVRSVYMELPSGTLVIMAAGGGALLSVLCDESADDGQVVYDMTRLINQMGQVLSVDQRLRPAPAR
jgi:predicted regulator of Ras-like GTPase activity (Roadblock/LC7/MglB family)